jgi:hypothetical protein
VTSAHKPGDGTGRKILYPESQYLAIIARYAEGENLLKILEEPEMPSWSAFWSNVCADDAPAELQAAYARAQESWATKAIAETPHIADTPHLGEERTVSNGPKGPTTTVKTADALGHRSLRISTRQWFATRLLAKLASKHALQNPDGSALAIPVLNVTVLPPTQEKAP